MSNKNERLFIMKKEKKLGFVKLALGTLGASLVVGAVAAVAFLPSSSPLLGGEAHASWISTAETVNQQVMESDLVVRVQVLEQAAPRHLWHPTPKGAMPGRFAFTDTQVEVLEVYRGGAQVGDRLWVMQTGGDLVTRGGKISRLELREDPLYELGSEMVLFLVDISGDSVHAPNRALFRTLNPAGRYEIQGGLVGRNGFGTVKARELDLASLEGEIRSAVEARNAIENF